jgi:hypothetical protein
MAVVPQSVPSVGVPANDAADHTNRTVPAATKDPSRPVIFDFFRCMIPVP